MPLRLEDASFEEGSSGKLVGGKIAICDCVALAEDTPPLFFIFQIGGQDHWHIQCFRCRRSFCPQGGCDQYDEKPNDKLDGEKPA